MHCAKCWCTYPVIACYEYNSTTLLLLLLLLVPVHPPLLLLPLLLVFRGGWLVVEETFKVHLQYFFDFPPPLSPLLLGLFVPADTLVQH